MVTSSFIISVYTYFFEIQKLQPLLLNQLQLTMVYLIFVAIVTLAIVYWLGCVWCQRKEIDAFNAAKLSALVTSRQSAKKRDCMEHSKQAMKKLSLDFPPIDSPPKKSIKIDTNDVKRWSAYGRLNNPLHQQHLSDSTIVNLSSTDTGANSSASSDGPKPLKRSYSADLNLKQAQSTREELNRIFRIKSKMLVKQLSKRKSAKVIII